MTRQVGPPPSSARTPQQSAVSTRTITASSEIPNQVREDATTTVDVSGYFSDADPDAVLSYAIVAGVDNNGDGLHDAGVDNNGDGDFSDAGVDNNGDGDFDDAAWSTTATTTSTTLAWMPTATATSPMMVTPYQTWHLMWHLTSYQTSLRPTPRSTHRSHNSLARTERRWIWSQSSRRPTRTGLRLPRHST